MTRGRPLPTEPGLHLQLEGHLEVFLDTQDQLSISNRRQQYGNQVEDRYHSRSKTRQWQSWHDQNPFSRMYMVPLVMLEHLTLARKEACNRSYSPSSRSLLAIIQSTILCRIPKILAFITSSRSGIDSGRVQVQQSMMSRRR